MPDTASGWEAADLIAARDPNIASRLLAAHPATGWCHACRTYSPCSMRELAEAVAQRSR